MPSVSDCSGIPVKPFYKLDEFLFDNGKVDIIGRKS